MHVHRVTTAEGETRQHAGSPFAMDTTLCGLSLDGDPEITRKIEDRDGSITCEQCLSIVRFCKTI
jgi:hypothetical protein